MFHAESHAYCIRLVASSEVLEPKKDESKIPRDVKILNLETKIALLKGEQSQLKFGLIPKEDESSQIIKDKLKKEKE